MSMAFSTWLFAVLARDDDDVLPRPLAPLDGALEMVCPTRLPLEPLPVGSSTRVPTMGRLKTGTDESIRVTTVLTFLLLFFLLFQLFHEFPLHWRQRPRLT